MEASANVQEAGGLPGIVLPVGELFAGAPDTTL
jgi:hypothetical protein